MGIASSAFRTTASCSTLRWDVSGVRVLRGLIANAPMMQVSATRHHFAETQLGPHADDGRLDVALVDPAHDSKRSVLAPSSAPRVHHRLLQQKIRISKTQREYMFRKRNVS